MQTLATFELKLETGWQLASPHGFPEVQQVTLVALPHWVMPDGQPHTANLVLAHAIPFAQHTDPHGVVPAGQQHPDSGSEHA